jgi:transketolase
MEHFAEGIGRRGDTERRRWDVLFASYRECSPELADEIDRMQRRDLPDAWDQALPTFPPDPKGLAGREASGQVLNAIAGRIPWVLGGAADLTPSTKTRLTDPRAGDLQPDNFAGRNLHFGVREHAMGSILNGLALTKLRPFGAGFLIFSDYARGAIRLSALMELPVVHIFTHDSIGVGEDGPTHQPIEHLISLRAIPHLIVLRPADANEIVEAWRVILTTRRQPIALILTRQPLPTLDRTRYASAQGVARGAYVLADPPEGTPDVILMASGSEVSLCVSAIAPLAAEGIRIRVVSMPSWELFEQQTQAYRDSVLPPSITARVAVEQASTLGWSRYTGTSGAVIGMTTFGMSAPLAVLQHEFGFTTDRVVSVARQQATRELGAGASVAR